ncbi:MAG: DUF6715 family protein [Lachnospiraceae bacterium]
MKRFEGKRGMIFLLLAVLLIAGYYYYISNRSAEQKKTEEEYVTVSEVQDLLLRDLTNNYPPSPKEVVKYYSEITKCLHNEKLSEEELYQLAMKIQELYDSELRENKSQEEYLADLKSEITIFQENDYAISDYATSVSTDVDFYSVDGYSFARLYCTYYIRVKTSMKSLNEVFLLRKDENDHWKIYGWQPVVDQQETDGNEE